MAIDKAEIRKWWHIFHGEKDLKGGADLVEIRMLATGRKKNGTLSGYFFDVESAIANIERCDGGFGIYAPINQIKASCSGRAQFDMISECVANTTSDNDIEGRRWMLIDLDPERPSGINSTDEEKKESYKVMIKIGTWMRDQGFSSPIVADSGNGYHLYYRIALANNAENTKLIKTVLEVLDMYFSNDKCKVDTSVFNASRIAKVMGTLSAKGKSTEERPQRMSRFIRIPDEITCNDIALLKKVASMLPQREQPSRYNGWSNERFDIEDFIVRHGIPIAKRERFGGGEKLILAECPFDSNHKAPDAALFIMDSGAIGFKCFHNSCSHYSWHDFRMHYEPDAYDRRTREEFEQRQRYYDGREKRAPVVIDETDEKGHKWLTLDEIEWVDPSTIEHIPTGIEKLDRKIGGFALGDVTVISGLSGAGKSSLINFIMLNAIDRGYKAAIWSGELQGFRLQSWIDQCAAGRNFVVRREEFDNYWYCPKKIAEVINKWLKGKFFLYNNDYGNKFSQIFSDIKDCVRDNGTQLIVLDNLMSLSLDSYAGEKNEKQTQFINDVKNFAKKSNISVIVVCHPRKEHMNTLLRMESISGTADLTNLVDNVLLAHRHGRDFEKRAEEFLGPITLQELAGYDEVIEVVKNRSLGIKDFFIGLYFEPESRRFLNDKSEYIVYGWVDRPTQMEIEYIPEESEFPE